MSGGQEGAEGSDQIMDLGEDQNNFKTKRTRATNWPKVMSKFLLDWYLEKKKAMPPKTKFKKTHHHHCQAALNARFKSAYTVDQVHRHLRRFKEVWNIVARYMNGKGSSFDKKHRMLILPSATMAALPLAERAILVKPIPFFYHLQALFSDYPVDGACMTDLCTDADLNDDELETPDPLNIMVTHADTGDPNESGLDKVVLEGEDDCHGVAVISGTGTLPCEVMTGTSAPSGSAESTRHINHIMDLGEDQNNFKTKRSRATNWPKVMSRFLLDWYLEKKKAMPPKTKFKKTHHHHCQAALNARFKSAYTVDQVHRHLRRFKEVWNIVARYMNGKGSSFDKKHRMLILPSATMAALPLAERAILVKPIPFFYHLQALFSDYPVDGACMTDLCTDADLNDDELETPDPLNIMVTHADTGDPNESGLDKVVLEGEDDCHGVAVISGTGTLPCEVMTGTSAPSGSAESTRHINHIMDLGEDQNNFKTKRSRATNWPKVMSRFLLDWYLEKKKAMPPKTKFKKTHHHYCQAALNARFESSYTVDQVHRHLRRFKEVWNIVARYMNKKGSSFDKRHRMLILPSATMAALPLAERAILVKPIPFFYHLQALFSDYPVDGACMTDLCTDADLNDDELETPDPLNIMVTHADTGDPNESGLDKVVLEGEDDCHGVAVISGTGTLPCEVMTGTSAPSGSAESTRHINHIMDLGEDQNNFKTKRSRATNWPKVMSRFLLDWYLEKKKAMPPKTKFKKTHHHYCQAALNARFESSYTVDQVHRHLRRFKEVWNIVARYMNKKGSSFDKRHRMLILPSATMASLPLSERAILVKPIPFFYHLQALFSDYPVDGASVTDLCTDADLTDDELETQDPLNMMVVHADTGDPNEADLDKVVLEGEDDCHEVAVVSGTGTVPCEVMTGTSAPSAEPSGSAESTMAALKPNLKKCKIVSKPKANPKSQAPPLHDSRKMDALNRNLISIHDSLAKPIRTAQPSPDPNAPLWNMLKEIPLTPADRLSVGIHLCRPESEVHRSFFMSMGKEYLEAWAHKFLAGGEPGAL